MNDAHPLDPSEWGVGPAKSPGRAVAGRSGSRLARVRGPKRSPVSTLKRGNKFGAKRTTVDGIDFPSKREANRWRQLKLLESAGRIRNLTRQRPYRFEINGTLVCRYISDFEYEEFDSGEWVSIVEDCKGYRTDVYRIKAKLMRACHGIEIRET